MNALCIFKRKNRKTNTYVWGYSFQGIDEGTMIDGKVKFTSIRITISGYETEEDARAAGQKHMKKFEDEEKYREAMEKIRYDELFEEEMQKHFEEEMKEEAEAYFKAKEQYNKLEQELNNKELTSENIIRITQEMHELEEFIDFCESYFQ